MEFRSKRLMWNVTRWKFCAGSCHERQLASLSIAVARYAVDFK